MKASKAQARLIKQNKQIIALLTMIADAAGLEAYDVESALDVQETIAPTKKPSRTRAEVAQDQAEEEQPSSSMPDSRDMSQSIPQDDSDNTDSAEPNELPTVD